MTIHDPTRINVDLPWRLAMELDNVVRGTGVSRNRYLVDLIRRHLESCRLIEAEPLTQERARLKSEARARDAEAIRSGERTVAQVRAANSLLANAERVEIDIAPKKRVSARAQPVRIELDAEQLDFIAERVANPREPSPKFVAAARKHAKKPAPSDHPWRGRVHPKK